MLALGARSSMSPGNVRADLGVGVSMPDLLNALAGNTIAMAHLCVVQWRFKNRNNVLVA